MTTHQQLLYHVVFSTKGRRPYLQNQQFRERVFSYMAATAKGLGGFAYRIGGYADHVHLLVRIPAKTAVSEFVGKLKANTSKHFNESGKQILKFGWQDGFGVFTVSPSQQNAVDTYIQNQVQHHSSQTFKDEYIQLLEKHEVEYNSDYVWE